VLRLVFPYLLFSFLALIVVFDNVGGRDELHIADGVTVAGEGEAAAAAAIGRDPVCHMDVGDKITAVVDGERYYFCTERCRELFVKDPEKYMGETCSVCRADAGLLRPVTEKGPGYTWQGKTYHFCGTEHRDKFAEDPAGYFIHTMWGIPNWLYGGSIALVLVLSFGLFEWIAKRSRTRPVPRARWSFFRVTGLRRVVKWPPFRFLMQAVFVFLFAMILIAGLFGNQLGSRNLAPLMTWTVWWGGLVLLILFFGKAWCYICPWDAVAGWIEKLRLWGKGNGGLSLGLKWPKPLRNIALATVFFVGLTWLELGFGITMSPKATALLGLLMLTLTVVSVLVFERKAFCRYACLVGRVSGLYAMFSSTEVRAIDRDVCRTCSGKDCYNGNEKGEGCPTGLFPAAITQNTYCIDCMECMKTCPEDNLALNARPWGEDLIEEGRPRKDEAYLALLMLAITGFHGLTMTPMWKAMLDALQGGLGLSYVPAFSLGMALLMLGPVLIYAVLLRATVWLSRVERVPYGRAFIAFAYSLLPIALFYHIAHNLEHLLMEGQKVIPLLSNPLGFAPGEAWSLLGLQGAGPWNLLGTAGWTIAPLVTLPTLWLLQVLLVLIGHVYSLWIADRTARRLYPEPGAAFRSQIPMLIGMVLFSIFSLWLLKQPMEMRTSAM